MSAKVTVKMPDLTIENPDKRFWLKTGLEASRRIRTRTENDGIDVFLKPFKKYSAAYAKKRSERGRTQRPNLSFTTQMLGSIVNGLVASAKGFKLRLTGEQGFKAWVNERSGRDFFGLDEKQKDTIFAKATAFYTRANKLKKR